VRYLYVLLFTDDAGSGSRHLQSLVVGGVILTASFVCLMLGVVADMISVNRALLENVLTEVKRGRSAAKGEPAFSAPETDPD
jgi:hypothetical protein